MNKLRFLIVCVITTICICGCSSTDSTTAKYKANMDVFFENMVTLDDNINAIEPESDEAVSKFLKYIDSMDTNFAQMASLEVPEGYEDLKTVAENASSKMSEAAGYFHTAYDGEYDDMAFSNGYDCYIDANNKLKIIVKALHGEYNSNSSDETSETDNPASDILTESISPSESEPSEDDFDTDEDTVFYTE